VEYLPGGESRIRLTAIVTGTVQGVNFRWFTSRQASTLGVVGFARNRGDGSVEVVAEGTETELKELVEILRHGPPSAIVDDVRVEYTPALNEFKDFRIRY
jgi:acylphosphatase